MKKLAYTFVALAIVLSALLVGCDHRHRRRVFVIRDTTQPPPAGDSDSEMIGSVKVCWPHDFSDSDRLLVRKAVTAHLTEWEINYGQTSKPVTIILVDEGKLLCTLPNNLDEVILVDIGNYLELPELYYLLTLYNFGHDFVDHNLEQICRATRRVLSSLVGTAIDQCNKSRCSNNVDKPSAGSGDDGHSLSSGSGDNDHNGDSSGSDDDDYTDVPDYDDNTRYKKCNRSGQETCSDDKDDYDYIFSGVFWRGRRHLTCKKVIAALRKLSDDTKRGIIGCVAKHYPDAYNWCLDKYGEEGVVEMWWHHVKLNKMCKEHILSLLK